MNGRFRFHGGAGPASANPFLPAVGGMDLRLVLDRPGVAPCPLQLTVKR
jgi:hypothetical protein